MSETSPQFKYGEQHPIDIEGFISNIPNLNRTEAIEHAREQRKSFLSKMWEREFSNLSPDTISKNNLSNDIDGWNRYLQFVYSQENEFQKEKFGFEERSVKYVADMVSTLEQDTYYTSQLEKRGEQVKRDLLKVPNSYYETHSKDGIFNCVIGNGVYRPIESDSLLVHAISGESLEKAIRSGTVGAGGLGVCAFSQDRIIYDNGYIIVYQAKDLIEVGYQLLQINEDPRDAKILKEWRTNTQVNLKLARLISTTVNIPDENGAKNQAQIAHTFFGETFLREIPRI